MGIRSRLVSDLSLALGTSEVNLLELTSAYGVFANQGVRTTPVFVLKVEDKNGKVLEQTRVTAEEALSPETALTMTSMLASVIENGTAAAARALGLGVPAAGKTGTTDDYTDAWFVGYTPDLVAGVWVGFDRKRKIGPSMTGAAAALPIWVDMIASATKGKPPVDFPVPSGVVSRHDLRADGAPRESRVPRDGGRALPRGERADRDLQRPPGRGAAAHRSRRVPAPRQRSAARGEAPPLGGAPPARALPRAPHDRPRRRAARRLLESRLRNAPDEAGPGEGVRHLPLLRRDRVSLQIFRAPRRRVRRGRAKERDRDSPCASSRAR